MSRHYNNQFGKQGEEWVAKRLEGFGYEVERQATNHTCDIVLNGFMHIEVKSATPTNAARGKGTRWQFSLRRRGLPLDEDLLILVCYDKNLAVIGALVIPGAEVPEELTKIDISSHPWHYGGKWAKYWEDWSVVDDVWVAKGFLPAMVMEQEEPGSDIPF